MRLTPFFIFVLLFLSVTARSQNAPQATQLIIQKTTTPITLDGKLEEEIWQTANRAKDFWQYSPIDSIPAINDTEVMITYDNENLYVGAIMHDTIEGDYIISSLRRDFDWINNDNISVYFDPMNDQVNGFSFQVSALNIQREGMVSQSTSVNDDWDNKWYSAVQNYDDRWTVEMRIPLKSFRYSENITDWNLQFLRNNRKANELTTWTKVPRQFTPNHFAFGGKTTWEEPPPPAGTNISIIPFIASGVSRDYEAENPETNYNLDVGFDAKIALTSSLNLDLTVNPDFSQVEVDQQVANLERFEIFFPERRQFFLENSDLFSDFGVPPIRPFFSRRIGIVRDANGNNVQVPILAGARLSGKLNQDWRVGFLNMQTAKKDEINLPAQNYTVATFQRRFMQRSTIGGIFVNKQAMNYDSENPNTLGSRYNRVAGLDINYSSNNNRWNGAVKYHHSFSPGEDPESYALMSNLSYSARNLNVFVVNEYVGNDFNAEVGFVPRTGFIKTFMELSTPFYPQNDVINSHGPNAFAFFLTDLDGTLNDRELRVGYDVEFMNNSSVGFEVGQQYVRLLDDFDPSNTGGEELLAGTEYTWEYAGIFYEFDRRKRFNFDVGAFFGGFYNGTGLIMEGSINYRYQPYGGIAMAFTWNNINFPEPYNDAKFWLIGPRIDFTFSEKVFFTTFIQYNEQIENININSRFQWRFKPVSDLFIVYTDNYFPDNFAVKNRALVLKLSYWFNL